MEETDPSWRAAGTSTTNRFCFAYPSPLTVHFTRSPGG
jgi:hypothetical protein